MARKLGRSFAKLLYSCWTVDAETTEEETWKGSFADCHSSWLTFFHRCLYRQLLNAKTRVSGRKLKTNGRFE